MYCPVFAGQYLLTKIQEMEGPPCLPLHFLPLLASFTEKQPLPVVGVYLIFANRSKRAFSPQEIQCLRNLMREGIPERIR